MAQYQTRFGSMVDCDKGGGAIINDDPRNYVFSNVFEVAGQSAPYKRLAVAKTFEYVIEAARAEGTGPGLAFAHDEFVLVMDGKVDLHLPKLAAPLVDAGRLGVGQALPAMHKGRFLRDGAITGKTCRADRPSVAVAGHSGG